MAKLDGLKMNASITDLEIFEKMLNLLKAMLKDDKVPVKYKETLNSILQESASL